jgi:hypothetical protein
MYLYMAILGKKFNVAKSAQRLGKKIDGAAHKLGKKADGIIDQAKNINNKVLQKVEGANKMIINKSANVLDKASGVLNKVGKITSVADTVLGGVPVVGNIAHGLNMGVQASKKTVNQLDDIHDKYAKQSTRAIDKYDRKSNKALNKASNVTGKLEKFNTRKAIAQLTKDNMENGDSFA